MSTTCDVTGPLYLKKRKSGAFFCQMSVSNITLSHNANRNDLNLCHM